MGGSYLVHGGVPHAQKMLAWAKDSERTARMMVIVFLAVGAGEGWLFSQNGHPAYIFGMALSAVLVILGVGLYLHHGKQVARWGAAIEDYERIRRDRMVHARRLEDWEL